MPKKVKPNNNSKINLDEFDDIPLDDTTPKPETKVELANPDLQQYTPHKILDPKNKKLNMGFSKDYNETSKGDAAQQKLLQSTYSDLCEEVEKYRLFVRDAANRLYDLEGGIANHDIGSGSINERLENLINDLDAQKIPNTISSITLQQMLPIQRNKAVDNLNSHIKVISNIADKVTAEYKHLNPTEGSKFAQQSNTMLNRFLDKFLTFVSKLKTKFGYTDHLKREIASDIKWMQTKHPQLVKLR